jgi:PAS domain S-box-containing protein
MVPNTAAECVLLGASLLLVRLTPISTVRRRVAAAFAFAVLALAAVTLAQYVFGRDLWVDRALPFLTSEPGTEFPGRSAPGTAGAFVLLATALLVLDAAPAVRADLSEVLAIGAGQLSLLAVAGYIYGAIDLYRGSRTGMSPLTAAAVAMLSMAVLCARPDRPLMTTVTSPRAGGFVVRHLLIGPPSILALGFVVMLGLQGSLYGEPFAAALLAVAAISIVGALVLSTGRALNRIDALRTASERALAEREERLSDLIEKASEGVFIADLDGRYTVVNDAGCKMVGYGREEILDKTVADLLADHEIPRLRSVKAELMRGGTHVGEWTMKRLDGTYLPVELSAKILPDGRWQAIVRDISVRKELEHATDAVVEAIGGAPQSSLQSVLQTIASEARLVTDAEYAALGLASAPDRRFDPWVLVGMPLERVSSIGGVPRVLGLLGFMSRPDAAVRIPDIRRDPAFRGFPPHHPQITSVLAVPIRRHGRSIGHLYLTNKHGNDEFTVADERAVERLAAQAATVIETARLYQAEGLERAWLHAMLDQMPEGVIVTDSSGEVRLENQTMQAFALKTGQHDPFGQPLHFDLRYPDGEPVPPDDYPRIRAIVDGVATKGRELALRHPDGRLVPVLVSAAPVYDEQGNRSGAVAIYQDITTLKNLERLREEWSSIVAHDLRQPLGVIALDADALAGMLDSGHFEECSKVIGRLRRSTKNMNKMIDDLLDVSRIEAHRLSIDCADIDLAAWLDELVERLSGLASGHPLTLSKTVDTAPVCVDVARIEQVLGNLVSNAAKHGEPGAEIGISLSRQDDEFVVAVTNRGRGIPVEELPRLFERFSRSAATSRSVAGLGLGLYICKGLVEAHGGRIWAQSAAGTTTFFFTIPPAPGAAGQPEHALLAARRT